jgi:hypothetical protein
MALNSNQIPVYGIFPRTSVGILSAATAGSLGSLTNTAIVLTAGNNGCIVDSVVASSTDSAAVNLLLSIANSGATQARPLGIVNVPIQAGNSGNTLNVDVISASVVPGLTVDQNGKRIVRLGPSETLRVATLANMTAGRVCYVTAQYTDL